MKMREREKESGEGGSKGRAEGRVKEELINKLLELDRSFFFIIKKYDFTFYTFFFGRSSTVEFWLAKCIQI